MILPSFYLSTRANQVWDYSGIDNADQCLDWVHFNNYPWPVQYKFNSRGFRDQEWPEDLHELKDAVWCFGDSFTVGFGAPWEHTWPFLLSKKINKRTINISMDGASNDWMSRKINEVIADIAPPWIAVQWSFTERREHPDSTLTDEQRRQWHIIGELEGIENLLGNINQVENHACTTVIHSTIPHFTTNQLSKTVLLKKHCRHSIPYFENLDRSRDGCHYDIKTADWVSSQMAEFLT